MISKEKILEDYNIIKSKAEKYFENDELEKCLATIEAAAFLAYNFNFFYFDERLEEILKKIGEKFKQEIQLKQGQAEHFVFYDSFGWDNRGLTQQYIRAILSSEVKITYILESNGNSSDSKAIMAELENSYNATIYLIPEKLSRIEKIQYINETLAKIKPTKIFTHKNPWNSFGNAVFSNVLNIEVFHINLTDHCFWLGRNAANYFIEFRNYGANISISHRMISENKILILPYYPIFNTNSFEGFPIDTEGKTKILIGGSFYKMYGDNGIFFKLLKIILDKHPETVLIIAGSGHIDPMNEFIYNNNFEHRVILLGDRRDINEIFKNIDIYIPTYPLSGGLMLQLAALNKKPIVAYTDVDLKCNLVEELVNFKNHQLTFFNEESFCNEVDKILNSETYRKDVSSKMNDVIVSENEFRNNLFYVIDNKKSSIPFLPYNIDIDRFAKIYLEAENNYLHSYDNFIYHYFRAAGIDIEMKYYVTIIRCLIKRYVKKGKLKLQG